VGAKKLETKSDEASPKRKASCSVESFKADSSFSSSVPVRLSLSLSLSFSLGSRGLQVRPSFLEEQHSFTLPHSSGFRAPLVSYHSFTFNLTFFS